MIGGRGAGGGDDSIKKICGGTIGGWSWGACRENWGKSGMKMALSGCGVGGRRGRRRFWGIEASSRIKSVSLGSLLWLGERMTTDTESVDERDLGLQPLDALMVARGVDNHALVAASPTQLTHKQVQRARKGRRLTKNMQAKVLDAWLRVAGGQEKVADLFNYRGL